MSANRRARPRQPKLVANAELLGYVQARLRKKWSPQQISNRLVKDFPAAPEMRVSTETTYQAIYVLFSEHQQLAKGRVSRSTRCG